MKQPKRHFNPAEELSGQPDQRSEVLVGTGDPHAALQICPECQSTLVHPTQWTPVDLNSWRVELRCPECELRVIDVYPQSVLDRFDLHLDGATQSMLDDLEQLERKNMEAELERFIANLADDRLLPEDF